MTPEERLDRVETGLGQLQEIVLGLANSQSRTADQIQSQQASIEVLQQATSQLQASTERLVEAQLATFTRMDEIASEVRGLQTENRRILERLEGLSSDDD